MRLDKRLSNLEKRSSPDQIKRIIELVGTSDEVENRDQYDQILRSSGVITVYELTPKPGYTPLPNN